MTWQAVLAIVDPAPAFVDIDPATLAQAVRKFGLEQLNAALARLRAALGDDRAAVLATIAEELGQLVAAGALDERWVPDAILGAARDCGLVRDLDVKRVERAIAVGLKLGKKSPRDLADVRAAVADGAAATRSGAQSGAIEDGRARKARDRMSSSGNTISSSQPPTIPAPLIGSEDEPAQTGDLPEASVSGGEGGDRNDGGKGNDQLNRRLAFFPLTDLGNAERFRERYRNRLRYWAAKETWLEYNGKRWNGVRARQIVKRAEHDTVRAIQDEAEAVRKSGRRDVPDALPGSLDYLFEQKRNGTEILYSDKIARWGRSSESLKNISALSKLGDAYLAVYTDELDADKMKINVNNGTLVVARKSDGDYISFQSHDPADLITKISPVDFDPGAQCPEYDKFLTRVHPSEAMRIFLHQWLGLSLTGDVSEQKLVYLYGFGANGKSVLMDTAGYIAGDYGETVPIETFLDSGRARSAGQASPDLAILPGVRMLRTSEPEQNSKLAESMVKLVTGGEPMLARHLNKGFFKFYPQFKLTISGNHKPKISGADDGIWRRFQLVPFNVSIPKEERDRKLSEKLINEASGILNRLLDGLRLWCDRGLIEPDEVTAATAEYRSLSDPLSRFLSACVETSPSDRIQSSVLYAVFEAWCKSAGESVWKQKGFSMAMDERGFKRKHSDVTWFLDLKLTRDVRDFVDGDGRPTTTGQQHESAEAANDEI
jgi:putative DNA primase/helicase